MVGGAGGQWVTDRLIRSQANPNTGTDALLSAGCLQRRISRTSQGRKLRTSESSNDLRADSYVHRAKTLVQANESRFSFEKKEDWVTIGVHNHKQVPRHSPSDSCREVLQIPR